MPASEAEGRSAPPKFEFLPLQKLQLRRGGVRRRWTSLHVEKCTGVGIGRALRHSGRQGTRATLDRCEGEGSRVGDSRDWRTRGRAARHRRRREARARARSSAPRRFDAGWQSAASFTRKRLACECARHIREKEVIAARGLVFR